MIFSKNKKGQVVMISGMIGFLVFIMAVQLISPVKTFIEDARSASGLDCSAADATTGVLATCVIVDWMLPGFIGALIFASISIAGGKLFKRVSEKAE